MPGSRMGLFKLNMIDDLSFFELKMVVMASLFFASVSHLLQHQNVYNIQL
jgi:hypothetical protein